MPTGYALRLRPRHNLSRNRIQFPTATAITIAGLSATMNDPFEEGDTQIKFTMKRHHSNALQLFALMFIQFAVITLNTVGIAHRNMPLVFVTDLTLTLLGFTLLKKCVEAETNLERISYALGGALGAQAALLFGWRA